MFKCVLSKVPFINIQIFRTFREIRICQYYMHVLFNIQIHMYKLYQLYLEMQAHIRLRSITTLMRWDYSNTLSLTTLKCLLTNISQAWIKGVYWEVCFQSLDNPSHNFSECVCVFWKGGGVLLQCNEGAGFRCRSWRVRAKSTFFFIEEAYRF